MVGSLASGKQKGARRLIYIDADRCDGCGECVAVCPVDGVRIEEALAVVDQESCNGCEVCMDACPAAAIVSMTGPASEDYAVTLQPQAVHPQPFARAQGVALRSSARMSVLPWLGAAAVFVGREIVPRVLDLLLDARDRDPQQGLNSVTGGQVPNETSQTVVGPTPAQRGGRRNQWRRRGGR